MNGPWHRGSRYWKGALEVQRLAAVIVGVVIWQVSEATPEAIGMFAGLVAVIYGGAAWINGKERSPEFQRAVAEREAQNGAAP